LKKKIEHPGDKQKRPQAVHEGKYRASCGCAGGGLQRQQEGSKCVSGKKDGNFGLYAEKIINRLMGEFTKKM